MEEEELRHLHEDMLEEKEEDEERGESAAEQHMEERSRPTTPKWWRPPIPPETYLWEEIRRKRQQGGYPWTLLDKDLNYGDNLYEPVNPPPLYGSKYNVSSSKKDPDSTSLDERMIEIPPEIEIITSEGLDGLDQPDPHDALGVDGDREWTSFHHDQDESQVVPSSKTSFTAGIRSQELPKVGETSNVRPLTSKTITFSPDVPPDDESSTTEAQPQASEEMPEEPTTSKPSALDQLKTKAGQVKQRISKISLPVRPKFNQWTGIRLTKRKKDQKKDQDQEPDEQEVPEGGGWTEPLSLVPEAEKKPSIPQPTAAAVAAAPPEPMEVDQSSSSPKQSETSQQAIQESKKATEAVVAPRPTPEVAEDETTQKKKLAEEEKKLAEDEKKRKDEELKRLKAEEKLQREREQEEVKKLKEQEKLQKQKEAEEQKRLKAEEKARKDKEAEEQKRLKAEEKARKEKEKEDQKKQKEEEKQRQLLLQQEMKRAQEEEVRKAKELEEEAKKTRQAEENTKEPAAAPAEEPHAQPDVPVVESTLESTSTAKTPEKKRKLIDIDFTKRFKRSKTPPPRPEPPKMKITKPPRAAPPQNQLAAQYADEIKARDAEIEAEDNRLREPQIFVTQPSIETVSSETPSDAQQQQQERAWGGEDIPRRTQRVVYDADNEEYEEEVGEEDMDEERVPTPSKQSRSKENFDKVGRKLKGFGVKSKAIAAQTGKSFGQTMKNVGHGIKEFGVNAVQEVKAKQEAVRQRDAQRKEEQAARAAEGGDEDAEPSSGDQLLKFRFRKRDKKPAVGRPEGQMVLEQLPEDREAPSTPQRSRARPTQRDDEDDKVHRSQLLGRAERDWESPLDLAQSRDASEEPFSGNASSRDSPPGSSMASSSIMQGRRQGVLEEIDSDEFFLRERGISEGEDEEEVNRFLVEELRQAFRPTMSNALDGFDLPSPPDRPERSPRKPPRKGKGSNNFQTFPPERPNRQRAPGYISSYINANPDEADYDNIQQNEEGEEDIPPEEEEELLDEDEAIRRVKEQLRKIDQDLEDDGRYEPVADEQEPVKPARRRKGRKFPERQLDTGFYYNTIAANEWMRDLEDQIEGDDGPQPVPPKRVKSKSGSLAPDIDDNEINFADDDIETESTARQPRAGSEQAPPLAQAESEGQIDGASPDLDDALDYVDEAGYAVVHKETPSLPKTFPRKKKRGRGGNGSKGNSLKRRSQEVRPTPSTSTTVVTPADAAGTGTNFFSLPRYTPRTFHIVPPTRPHRAYSTLRPKRPPRHKSKSNQNLHGSGMTTNVATTISPAPSPRPTTPASPGSRRDAEDRPSTAIGIQGRPLPAPPRPERSPAPAPHDLDPESFERMVNMRHYANYDEETGAVEVQEELCVARNIPLLTQRDPDETSELAVNDINVGVQTDPIQDEEYELNIATGSFEEDLERIEKTSSVSHLLPSDDQDQGDELPPPIPERPLPRIPPQSTITPPQLVFPTRLHLDELEVDVLRVNDLTANSLSLTHIQAPHLELNTLSARGPLSVPSITTPNMTVDRVDCRSLSSEAAEVPSISIPPPSFYNLACPPVEPSLCPESSEECPDGGQDSCVCPPSEESPSIDAQSQQVVRQSVPSQPPITRSSTLAASRTSSTHTADPDLEDIAHSSVRLGRALLRVTVRTLQAMAEYVEVAASTDPECKEQQRSNMQVLMCLLLVLVAGIILICRSSGVEPRWQYFLPPSDI